MRAHDIITLQAMASVAPPNHVIRLMFREAQGDDACVRVDCFLAHGVTPDMPMEGGFEWADIEPLSNDNGFRTCFCANNWRRGYTLRKCQP